MATIRIPESIRAAVYDHLFSTAGEHFAFMLARWSYSPGGPIFIVYDAILIPDTQVKVTSYGWELTTDAILNALNSAVRSGLALVEVHNHDSVQPRFSSIDRDGFQEFLVYVFQSLPNRPYAAMVWSNISVYSEYFLPNGQTGVVNSVTVVGDRLRQLVSGDEDLGPIAPVFDRQLPWFTKYGQRALGRLLVGIVGAGGTGSQVIQNLVYLGVRNFVLIDNDKVSYSNLNRLVTATVGDIGVSKAKLGQRVIKSVARDSNVSVITRRVQSAKALNTLKGVDVVFGCVDNDAPRLILNELALAYNIPYFDIAVGIDAKDGKVSIAGGRVAIVLPEGPCLYCTGEIDTDEAHFFLSSAKEQAFQIDRGYVRGMAIIAPSVVSLNATMAAVAVNEFAVFVSGLRPVNIYTELDLLGIGRPLKSQWITPKRIDANPGCVQCTLAGKGDAAGIERYAINPGEKSLSNIKIGKK